MRHERGWQEKIAARTARRLQANLQRAAEAARGPSMEADEAGRAAYEAELLTAAALRFARTYCSQCGGEFGAGDSGFSHCKDHAPAVNLMTTTEVLAEVVRCMRETGRDFYADQVHAAALTLSDWQKRCIAEGFRYWRAPDAHGVTCTKEQAENMLAAVLGVEVEIGA